MLKKVMKSIYAHNSNFEEWKQDVLKYIDEEEFDELLYFAKDLFKQTVGSNSYVMKYDRIKNSISLIDTSDWDTENEPTVGDAVCCWKDSDGELQAKKIKCKDQIYHNKWQFVQPDYSGFDVEEAKERTELWNSIPDINSHKSRIGYRKYWNQLLKDNGIPL